jgi:hypothetical protein
MDSTGRQGGTDGFTLAGAAAALVHFAVALFAALLMVGVLFFGLLLGLGLMVFALLRGRRPQSVPFIWRKGQWPGRPRSASTPDGAGEVVDIEARVIPTDESKAR